VGIFTRSTCSRRVAVVLAAILMVCLSSGPTFAASKTEVSVSFCADNHCNKDTFPILGVNQIDILTTWRNISAGDHVQDLKLILPNGDVYQVLHTEFTTAAAKRHGRVKALTTGSGHSLDTVLPVRGTWIQQFSLAGAWTVQVSLDGSPVHTSKFAFTTAAQKGAKHDD
jgi:hypothetical protein